MGEEFDSSQPSHFLIHINANNSYGWAMGQKFPTGGLRWVELNFSDYKHCLLSSTENAYRKQLMFQNKLHEVRTVEVDKVAMSRDDNKRNVRSNGESMLAHGHKESLFHNTLND